MGRKKGKGKGQDEKRADGVSLDADKTATGDVESSVKAATAAAGGGGKKGKRKKKDFEDYDEELTSIAAEIGIDAGGRDDDNKKPTEPVKQDSTAEQLVKQDSTAEQPVKQDSTTEQPVKQDSTAEQPVKQDSTTEQPVKQDVVAGVERKETGKGGKKSKKKKKKELDDDELDAIVRDIESGAATSSDATGNGTLTEDAPTKKEDKPMEVTTNSSGIEPKVTIEESSVVDDLKSEAAVADEETEDSKRKKKKKKKDDEKKSRGKGAPGKATISRIKKMKEAMEEERRKREEEALAAQREEEERERKRLEKIRLEQERKERQKQKEKERLQRRKLEGKPVTKREREAEARRQAALSVLREQGIAVPEKQQSSSDGGKGKVLYGGRVRKKTRTTTTTAETVANETEEAEATVQADQVERETTDDGVKENWFDGDEWDDNVKTNWDDEEDEIKKVGDTSPDSTVSMETPKDSEPADSGSSEDEGSSADSDSSSSEDEEDLTPLEKARKRIRKRRARHEAERSLDTLRSPVVCVLGHVDTGKTKILDKIRRTNVQDGEAGGITQQIGATFVPEEAIRDQTKMLKEFSKTEVKIPGLLIIDTPGHESFSNLRSRGSSLCDLAILVVDIMHGLEAQTLESLNLLRKRGTPFIVALNKIDRLYDWRRNPSAGVKETLKRQKPNTKDDFDDRVKQTITEFAEQGLNVALFWEKVDFSEYIPLVPTSAITGDGMGDLIALLVNYSVKVIPQQLTLSMELEAVVMEVKVIAGLGTTVDVILRNGVLREGDTLIMTGSEGPFVTSVRALLMPQPLRELRVKNAYVNHKAVIASQGIKITAKGELDKTLAGTPVFVARKIDEVDVFKEEASRVMKNVLSSIKLHERGVYVQASTLGSLEALLEFLKVSKIPYCGVSIGPVHKKDVMKASVMLEHDSQWAVILAFDVRVEREAQEMADSVGVRIFSADIIYHLFDSFLKHRKELRERKRREFEHIAVFPCKLRILPNCVFNTRDPIVVGVIVEAGIIKKGTPLTVPSKNFVDIGVVSSLEANHKSVDSAHTGMEVCIKVESVGGEAPRLYGRHFDHTDTVVSKISRESIDAVKNYFREDLQKSDWQLMIELKKTFQIL